MDMILDLKRINRRMHNKSFIADNQVALIGGRNMTNQYYNVSDNYQFSDVDVMLVGAAVDDIVILLMITGIMNMHIQSSIVSAQQHRLRYESLKEQLDAHYQQATVQNFLT
jgi:putative cardiolipin synthase